MPKALSEAVAVAVMVSAGLPPAVPYPGAGAPWQCSCLRCGHTVTPRFGNVKKGSGGCGFCSGRFVDAGELGRKMERFGWELLEPYTSSQHPWRVRCRACQRETTKRWNDVVSGKPGCRFCAGRAVTPSEAIASMREARLEPQVPYPGGHAPWPCQCMDCDAMVAPNLNTVRASGSGCRHCAWRRSGLAIRTHDDVATAAMEDRGFTPEEPYPGSHAKWWCVHNACGTRLQVRHHDIVDGGTGCSSCSVSGFKPTLPADLYLITHPGLNCHKIGIAGRHSNRLALWGKQGWSCYRTRYFDVGGDAYQVEQAVLRWIRTELHLPAYLGVGDGRSETVCADGISLDELWGAAERFARAPQEARGSGQSSVPLSARP